MFFCNKWTSSNGRLREPWIQGIFKGNIPTYIKHKYTNLQSACNDLNQLVTNRSNNIKHRISLRFSAQLCYGMCNLYQQRVTQLFDSCTHEEIEFEKRKTVSTEFCTNESEMSEDYEETTTTDISSTDEHMDTMRQLESSTEDRRWSTGLDDDVSMSLFTKYSHSPVMVMPQSYTQVDNDWDEMSEAIPHRRNLFSSPEFKLYSIPEVSDEYKTDSSIEDLRLLENFMKDAPTQKSTSESNETVRDDPGNKICQQKTLDVGNNFHNKSSESNANEESLSQLSGVGKVFSSDINIKSIVQYSKIQDTYENFICQWCSKDIAESSIVRRRKKIPLCDKRTKLSIYQIKRNLVDSKFHKKPKNKIENAIDIKLRKCSHLLRNPGRANGCAVLKKMWNRCLITREDDCDKYIFLQETIPETENVMCDEMTKSNEQQYDDVTIRLDISDLPNLTVGRNDTIPVSIIPPDNIIEDVWNKDHSEDGTALHFETSPNTLSGISFIENILQTSPTLQKDKPTSPQEPMNSNVEDQIHIDDEDMDDMNSTYDRVEDTRHKGIVNVVLPKYLRHRVDPNEIKVIKGSMINYNAIRVNNSSNSESCFENSNQDNTSQDVKFRREWSEDGVRKKLFRLWHRIRLVSPEKLLNQGSHCGNKQMAKAKMFHSLIRLKAKGVVSFKKNFSGNIEYITKGYLTKKINHTISA